MFIDNKYTKWYNLIITKANSLNRNKKEDYFEEHHIIPKSMGGNNKKSNLVLLTAREHLLVHILLPKMASDLKDIHRMNCALLRMSKSRSSKFTLTPKQYERVKRQFALTMSKTIGDKLRGRSLSDEHKFKISQIQKKAWKNNNDRLNKLIEHNKTTMARPHSEEQKTKISKSSKASWTNAEERRQKLVERNHSRIGMKYKVRQ